MGKIKLEPATPQHVTHMLDIGIRQCDMDEISRWRGRSIATEMYDSQQNSEFVYTMLRNGRPFSMFGVRAASPLLRNGVIWMIATEEIYEVRAGFALLSKKIMNIIKEDWDLLFNWVDARNVESIEWLQFLGFTVENDELPVGINGDCFRHFYMKGVRDVR